MVVAPVQVGPATGVAIPPSDSSQRSPGTPCSPSGGCGPLSPRIVLRLSGPWALPPPVGTVSPGLLARVTAGLAPTTVRTLVTDLSELGEAKVVAGERGRKPFRVAPSHVPYFKITPPLEDFIQNGHGSKQDSSPFQSHSALACWRP